MELEPNRDMLNMNDKTQTSRYLSQRLIQWLFANGQRRCVEKLTGVLGSCMVNSWFMHGRHDDSFVGIDLAEDPGPEPEEHLSFCS